MNHLRRFELGQHVRTRLQKLRKKNNQKGFTLIELLVVVSILGILAAVVTMSMVGVTKLAQNRAAATERLRSDMRPSREHELGFGRHPL